MWSQKGKRKIKTMCSLELEVNKYLFIEYQLRSGYKL